jgi:hypothetical protein
MPTLFDPPTRAALLARLRRLTPDAPRRWGRMDAPRMVAHLSDQMRHTLGDTLCRPVPSLLRFAPLRHAAIHWIPWPRGRVQGPPDAFVTPPADWAADLEALVALVERVGARDPAGPWPAHALFGPMTGRDWGVFCHKHVDHHLRQFGV